MLHTIPGDSRSQNMFNFSVPFHLENAKWWNIYINVLWHYIRKSLTGLNHMTSHVKELVLLSLLNIAAVDSKVSSSLKTTRHEAFSFWYHINKIHTQRSTSLLYLLRHFHSLATAVCGICSCSIRQTAFHSRTRDFPGLLNIHVSSDHRSYCDSPEMRTIFQLHYGAVNQSPSQQMSQCLATGGIALCLHAVQQCGCKIILRERK